MLEIRSRDLPGSYKEWLLLLLKWVKSGALIEGMGYSYAEDAGGNEVEPQAVAERASFLGMVDRVELWLPIQGKLQAAALVAFSGVKFTTGAPLSILSQRFGRWGVERILRRAIQMEEEGRGQKVKKVAKRAQQPAPQQTLRRNPFDPPDWGVLLAEEPVRR